MTRPAAAAPRRAVGRPTAGEDLRAVLVAATLRLLEQTGDPAAVTVAGIVAEAGCTPPTLYHYWPRRELLLREASALGFKRFRRSQASAAAPAGDPLDRIRRRGQAYLDFALSQPSLFRVLFLDRPVPGHPPADAENPGQGLADLAADVSAAMTASQLAPEDPLGVAVGLWAGVHGIAALWVATPELPHALARSVAAKQTAALLTGYGYTPTRTGG
ncbi:MAG TPA: TetR/AcrR family transcriptional regulator [Actinomycetes bacterium]